MIAGPMLEKGHMVLIRWPFASVKRTTGREIGPDGKKHIFDQLR